MANPRNFLFKTKSQILNIISFARNDGDQAVKIMFVENPITNFKYIEIFKVQDNGEQEGLRKSTFESQLIVVNQDGIFETGINKSETLENVYPCFTFDGYVLMPHQKPEIIEGDALNIEHYFNTQRKNWNQVDPEKLHITAEQFVALFKGDQSPRETTMEIPLSLNMQSELMKIPNNIRKFINISLEI